MSLHLPIIRRRRAPALLGLVLAASLAACGGASGNDNGGVVSLASPSASPGASGSPAASVDPEDAMQAFAACMKEHGVDVQVATSSGGGGPVGGVKVAGPGASGAADPQAGQGNADPKAMEAADKACRSLLPSGMIGDPGATMPPEQVEAMLGYAKCMRDHGLDFPDPKFEGGGMSISIGGPDAGGVDPSSKQWQDAEADCAKAMPSGAPFVFGGSSVEVKP